MKRWRSGFMRWRRRDGPCGSHQLDARALKWETSVGSTEEALLEVDESARVECSREEVAGLCKDCCARSERRVVGSWSTLAVTLLREMDIVQIGMSWWSSVAAIIFQWWTG